jgi:short-subunit dehydrogenase
MVTLRNQVAVISGASSGIGRAIALALAAEGANLHLIGRRMDALGAVAERARERAGKVTLHPADLSDDGQLNNLAATLRRHCDGIDALVHSAGVFARGPVRTAPVAEFDRLFRVNVRAPYLLTQLLLPMLLARRGQIVFINSSVGLMTHADLSQYSATKHALKAVADCLRTEVNAEGVRVLSVYPGRTATPQQEAVHQLEGRQFRPELLMQPEDVAAVVVHALQAERTAEITDINIRPLNKI